MDKGVRWVDGKYVPSTTTDEGNTTAEVAHARNYVWDPVGLTWVRQTQTAGGGGAGGAVTLADGADVTQGAKADAAWVSGDGTVISLLKKVATGNVGAPKGHSAMAVTTSVALTVPIGAIRVVIRTKGNGISWTDDGQTPTTSLGMYLLADETLVYDGNLAAFKMASLAGTADVRVAYYSN